MKYILYLTDKDPANNMTIECETAQEVLEHKRKAIEQGFQVTVKGEKNEQDQSSAEK